MASISGQLKKWLIGLSIVGITAILVSGCAPANAPVINSLTAEREAVIALGCCQIECNATDPEGGELNYEWSANGGTITGEGDTITWIAPGELGEYTISVNVTNEKGKLAARSINISVVQNEPPKIYSLIASDARIIPSGNCTVSCEASDPEGTKLSYAWSASGGNITGKGHTIVWTAPESVGNYTITVVVTDEMGSKTTRSLPIRVAINHQPVIGTVVAQAPRINPTHSTTIDCSASDPDGDELSYTWSADAGEISAEGNIATWTAPDCEGTYNVTVVVRDGRGGEATQTVRILVGCG